MEEDKKKKDRTSNESAYGREQFDNMIEEDTSSSEQEKENKITRVGYIEMKKLKKKTGTSSWKAVHCVLVGGSFYWYKNAKDAVPMSGCDLKDVDILPSENYLDRDCFVLRDKDANDLFIGFITSQSNKEAWVRFFTEGREKEPKPYVERTTVLTKKPSLVDRTKNKVVSKTATSTVGKKVMKAFVNEETTGLLSALKAIIKKESDSKKADDLEKNIIKIAVKSYLLIEKGKLDGDEFLRIDKPLRNAFDQLSRCYVDRYKISHENFVEELKAVEQLLKEAEETLTNLLAPFLTPKNLFRISSVFGTLADYQFLETVFADETLEEELDKLINAMEYYIQFHYHN